MSADFSAEELRKVFNAMAEEEKTDALSKASFKALVQGLLLQRGNAVVADADLDAAFTAADDDLSGSVDLFEFIRLFDLVKSGALLGLGSAPPSVLQASPAKKRGATVGRPFVEGDVCTWTMSDADLPTGTLGRVLRVHNDGDVEVLFSPLGKPAAVYTFGDDSLVPARPKAAAPLAAAAAASAAAVTAAAPDALAVSPAAAASAASAAAAIERTMSGNVYVEKRNLWVRGARQQLALS
jgi:hypothetical protein